MTNYISTWVESQERLFTENHHLTETIANDYVLKKSYCKTLYSSTQLGLLWFQVQAVASKKLLHGEESSAVSNLPGIS